MPKIDIACVPHRKGSSYPAPFDREVADRIRQSSGDGGGLTDFGVNLLTLPPGTWSSQRHRHSAGDEFVCVLTGEVALVTDQGEVILKPGDCAAFPKNDGNGHHLVNRSNAAASVPEAGARSGDDICTYSDIDMIASEKGYTHKDGMPILRAKIRAAESNDVSRSNRD